MPCAAKNVFAMPPPTQTRRPFHQVQEDVDLIFDFRAADGANERVVRIARSACRVLRVRLPSASRRHAADTMRSLRWKRARGERFRTRRSRRGRPATPERARTRDRSSSSSSWKRTFSSSRTSPSRSAATASAAAVPRTRVRKRPETPAVSKVLLQPVQAKAWARACRRGVRDATARSCVRRARGASAACRAPLDARVVRDRRRLSSAR